MKIIWTYITLFLLLFTAYAWPESEEAATKDTEESALQAATNLNNLEVGWWEYFDFTGPKLESHINKFVESLETTIQPLSPESKKRAESLIEKIKVNLKTYEQSIQHTAPPPPAPAPLKEEYTINEVVEIYRQISKQKIDLKSQNDELLDKQSQISTTEDLLTNTKRKYSNAARRSEEKVLTALEIITIRTSLEKLKQAQLNLEQSIKTKSTAITQVEDELATAVRRMVGNDLDIILFSREVSEWTAKVEEAEATYRELETKEAAALSESLGAEQDEAYLELSQKADQAEINLMIARNQLIFSKIKLELARLLTDPQGTDLTAIMKEARQWNSLLPIYRSKLSEWKTQAERQLQRAGPVLSKGSTGPQSEEERLTETQKNILSLAQNNLLLIQQLDNNIQDTEFLLGVLSSKVSKLVGGGQRWLESAWELLNGIYKQTSTWINRELFYIGKNPVTFLSIFEFFFIIILTLWLSRVLLKGITRIIGQRKGVRKSLVYRVSRLFYYFLLAIGLLIALSTLGFDFSNVLLLAGALGVGLGFGLQSIFNNFISGIILLFESHLKVGDFIELESGLRGEIREINVRSTLITDNDGIDVLIPNSEIVSNKVLNWTLKVPYRRIHVPFTVAYGTDKDHLAKIVVEAAKKVPHTLSKLGIPEPVVRLHELGPDGLEFELIVWVTEKYTKRSRTTRSDYLWAIETALSKENITIPFPQRVVHLANNDGKVG